MAHYGAQPQYSGQPQFHGQQQPLYGQPVYGQENPDEKNIAAVPPYVRSQFIQKVYSILSVQLAVTVAIAIYVHRFLGKEFVLQNRMIFQGMSLVGVALLLGVSCCCSQVLRQFPLNFIFLAIFTICQSAATSLVTMMYTADSVMLALLVTAGVFFALTAYACVTKSDFTGMGVYLFGFLAVLMIFGLVIFLWPLVTGSPAPHMMRLVYSGLGVLLFMFYIIYDTQLIVGGTHKQHQFSVDDYVFAALNLYLDIINLFIYILQLMGNRS